MRTPLVIQVQSVGSRYHFESASRPDIKPNPKGCQKQGVRIATIWHRIFGRSTDLKIGSKIYKVNTNSLKKYIQNLSTENKEKISFAKQTPEEKGNLVVTKVSAFIQPIIERIEKKECELKEKIKELNNTHNTYVESLETTLRTNDIALGSQQHYDDNNGLLSLTVGHDAPESSLTKAINSYNQLTHEFSQKYSSPKKKAQPLLKLATKAFTWIRDNAELAIHNYQEGKAQLQIADREVKKAVQQKVREVAVGAVCKRREQILDKAAERFTSSDKPASARPVVSLIQSAAGNIAESVAEQTGDFLCNNASKIAQGTLIAVGAFAAYKVGEAVLPRVVEQGAKRAIASITKDTKDTEDPLAEAKARINQAKEEVIKEIETLKCEHAKKIANINEKISRLHLDLSENSEDAITERPTLRQRARRGSTISNDSVISDSSEDSYQSSSTASQSDAGVVEDISDEFNQSYSIADVYKPYPLSPRS